MQQQGLTLTEILISLFILCIGLLAILKMQVYSLQAADNAYYASQAIIRLHSIQNIQQAKLKNFPSLYQQWQATNSSLLPQAQSKLNGQQIELSWFDRFSNKRQSLSS